MDEKTLIDRIERTMKKLYPDIKKYKIYKYKKFYTAVMDQMEPVLFESEHAFPMMKNFAEIPASDCKNPELIKEVK